MKQTSQAIALLVASTNAAAIATVSGWQNANANWLSNNAAPVNGIAASSRTAGYNSILETNWTWSAVVYNKTKVTANSATAYGTSVETITNSSTCMQCIGGGGVWCSRTYSFVVTGTAVALYQAQTASGLYANSMDISQVKATDTATMWTAATALDQGACCGSKSDFVLLAGSTGLTGVNTATVWTPDATTSLSGIQGNSPSCPAMAQAAISGGGASAALFAAAAFDDAATAYSSWWCSNGLYKNVLTAGSTSNTTTVSQNKVQMFGQGDNQRAELARVGCPNLLMMCGGSTMGTGVYTLADATTTTVTIAKASTLGLKDKCTWVATSMLYAPTFQLKNGTDNLGLVTSNWKIHHMEYMTRSDLTTSGTATGETGLLVQASNAAAGATTDTNDLGVGNFVPKVNMTASSFATMRTWYGNGASSTNLFAAGTSPYGQRQSMQWFTPYQQSKSSWTTPDSAFYATVDNNQWFGNVSNMPASKMANQTTTAAAIPAGSNYGNNGSAYFDFRVVRYIPVSAAQTVWTAGSALNTLYTAKTTSYATAKTTWNAYVAILKKNAKMDAFAAAFSPPKAPTVPPLPNMPWTPAPYSGYLKQTPSQNWLMGSNVAMSSVFVEASQPTAQQFWASLDAAQTIGGWGSFTAQIITYRNAWGKSFGTIGYSGASGFNDKSQIWSYKQMCSTPNVQATGSACDSTYSGTGSTATAATTTLNGATATTSWSFVTVISLWSNGDLLSSASPTNNVWTQKQSLQIEFTGKLWSNSLGAMSAISQPAAPTAADSLTGVAGASALAASSAAVLAIAALY